MRCTNSDAGVSHAGLGVDWAWSKERTFLPSFKHPDGTNTTHISRQRPQLVFGPGAVPTHLITGIAVASTNRPYVPQHMQCMCNATPTSMVLDRGIHDSSRVLPVFEAVTLCTKCARNQKKVSSNPE